MKSEQATTATVPDADQSPATVELLSVMDDLAENARYTTDPGKLIARFSEAFAAYLRSAD